MTAATGKKVRPELLKTAAAESEGDGGNDDDDDDDDDDDGDDDDNGDGYGHVSMGMTFDTAQLGANCAERQWQNKGEHWR